MNMRGIMSRHSWDGVHYTGKAPSTGQGQLKLSSPTETKISLGFLPFSPLCSSSVPAESGKLRDVRNPAATRIHPTATQMHPTVLKHRDRDCKSQDFQSAISKPFLLQTAGL